MPALSTSMEGFNPGQEPAPEGKNPETPAVDPSVEAAVRALQEKLAKEKNGDPLDNEALVKKALADNAAEAQMLAEHPPKAPGA
jgi:hypothetical protein